MISEPHYCLHESATVRLQVNSPSVNLQPGGCTLSTDRIEKQILLRAPLSRVWKAVSDPDEIAAWFGMRFHGALTPGARLPVSIVGTSVDPEVAAAQKKHAGLKFEVIIDRVEPPRLISFRWHPGAVDPGADYSQEPTTLVSFTLDEVPEGVRLTVTESGFDRIPLARRAQAFEGNHQGWAIVVTLLEKYLAASA
jgi:uncharacterized protein YndB with AHSA1/START domain